MLTSLPVTSNTNFSLPFNLNFMGTHKDSFNVTSPENFDPPPPPGGPGAPFSPLFNQPVFKLVPTITIDLSFLKKLALPNVLTSLATWSFSKLSWGSNKDSFLPKHTFSQFTEKTQDHFADLYGTVNPPETIIWAFPVTESFPLSEACQAKVDAVVEAAEKGDMEKLQNIKKEGFINFSSLSSKGCTAAGRAALHGHLDVLKFLNTEKVNFNEEDTSGDSPIHCAAREGHLDALKFLTTSGGCSLDAANSEGANVAHFAAAGGHMHILDYLKECSFNFQQGDRKGRLPINYAHLKQKAEARVYLNKIVEEKRRTEGCTLL